MTEKKEDLIDITLYNGYLNLVEHCQLPLVVTREKLTGLLSLDHYVLCATKYKTRQEEDDITKAHCEEVWKKWNSPELKTSINLCVRMLLNPAPSETILLKSKLVILYLNGL